ncbi:hypothetical protein ACRAR1_03835 [Streptomyces sanyensis]|uniref:hypothetical protein n=1 Tax=Streptomyces sanyensis TaxID=568869 RepID=UPI003D780A10
MTTGRWCRAARAAMFAATCVVLAAVGHILMSGSPVGPGGLAAALAVTGALAWLLGGRERTPGAVTGATVAVQAGLHAAFSLAQALAAPRTGPGSLLREWAGHLLCSPAPGTGAHLSDAAAAHSAGHLGHGAAHLAHGAMPAGHGSAGMSPAGMLAAHLLAALLCGLWLAHGERAVFRVLHALAGWLAAPLRCVLRLAPPPGAPRSRVRRRRACARLRPLLLASSCVTRGPPAGSAVC